MISAYLLPYVLSLIGISAPWWLDVPSVFGFYGIYLALFDRYLWRWPLLRKIGVVQVPVFEGHWEGYLCSSFDGYGQRHRVTVTIYQRWTEISISLKSPTSSSRSLIASITLYPAQGPVLVYEYENRPKANAQPTMHIHYGTACLNLLCGGTRLLGEYYTGRDRQNYGTMELEKCMSPATLKFNSF